MIEEQKKNGDGTMMDFLSLGGRDDNISYPREMYIEDLTHPQLPERSYVFGSAVVFENQ